MRTVKVITCKENSSSIIIKIQINYRQIQASSLLIIWFPKRRCEKQVLSVGEEGGMHRGSLWMLAAFRWRHSAREGCGRASREFWDMQAKTCFIALGANSLWAHPQQSPPEENVVKPHSYNYATQPLQSTGWEAGSQQSCQWSLARPRNCMAFTGFHSWSSNRTTAEVSHDSPSLGWREAGTRKERRHFLSTFPPQPPPGSILTLIFTWQQTFKIIVLYT